MPDKPTNDPTKIYTPNPDSLMADPTDPFWSFIGGAVKGLFDLPGALMNFIQGTPQLDEKVFKTPLVTEQEGTQFVSDVNDLNLIDRGVVTRDQLDAAFHENANGNPAALRALIDRAAGVRNYDVNYKPIENSYDAMVSSLQDYIKNGIYSPDDISYAVSSNSSDMIRNRDRNLQVGREELAGRGIQGGITADMVSQARQLTDELVQKGKFEIPKMMDEANFNVRNAATGSLTNLETGLGANLAGLKAGTITEMNPNDLTSALQAENINNEMVRFQNKMLTKQSFGETKADAQQQFDNMMSIFSMIGSMKGGGGGKQKSGGGGGLTAFGFGGSYNQSCTSEDGIVVTPKGFKRLFQIEEGDQVLTPKGFKKVLYRDWGYVKPENQDIYLKFITNKRPIILTANHLIGGRPAKTYIAGDSFPSFKKPYEILRVERIAYTPSTDLLLDGADQYFVNGVLIDSMCSRIVRS